MINKRKYIIVVIIVVVMVIVVLTRGLFTKDNSYNQINLGEIIATSEENIVSNELEKKAIPDTIKIHITGQVNNQGLIELEAGSRIQDAINLAGGLTENADTSKTNLAYILSDGEKIYIPSFEDEDNQLLGNTQNSNIKVNINTATLKDLERIPGVGESTANSIIEYREKTGKYITIEDIMNVSGIGENKFEKMKEYITVK